MSLEEIQLETEALKELLELAVKLKKSGLLNIAEAVLNAAEKIDETQLQKIKKNTEESMFCLFNTLSSTEPSRAEKVKGIFGLMGALRDPDVQKGLGFIIALAKNLGGCLNKTK